VKPAKRIITICAAVAATTFLGGTAAHADGDGGLLGLGLLNTPSITLACFPAGQVGSGNSFTGNQNINCSQSAQATAPEGSRGGGVTGAELVFGNLVTIPPGESRELTVDCPAGKIATGGGFDGGPDIREAGSIGVTAFGTPYPVAWRETLVNEGSEAQNAYPNVVCVDSADPIS
jgi:hypothetical protein